MSFRQEKTNAASARVLSLVAVFLGLVLVTLGGVPQDTPRKIVSDDFTKNRPQAPVLGSTNQNSASSRTNRQSARTGRSNTARQHRTYRLKSSQRTARRQPSKRENLFAQLGITIWRLRPARNSDGVTRALIREKSSSSGWVPERVEADTTFREGDRVRLSVESPTKGYLYVIDRDLFADGTAGRPMLIYPWVGTDNELRAGKLVDIPSQDDDPSYFTARLTTPNQAGELLTFIVSPLPLDLPISDKPLQISNVQMTEWEKLWVGSTERFELEGGVGEAWTLVEQQAATRKPGRQLTRDDPAPQTIYRISGGNSKVMFVNVRLRYSK
jgi:hypothetical protein